MSLECTLSRGYTKTPVFYFLGRAVKRCAEEKTALEYPEDVLFLLDSVGDNFKTFRRAMNDLAADCGRTVFKSPGDEVPPFREISAYRDIFLHNTVMGRGVGVEKTYMGFFAQPPKTANSELRQHRTALLAVVDRDCTNTADTSKPSIEDVPSFESTTVLNLAGAEKREEIRLPSRERRRAFSIDGSAHRRMTADSEKRFPTSGSGVSC